jgi:hypothetical protein
MHDDHHHPHHHEHGHHHHHDGGYHHGHGHGLGHNHAAADHLHSHLPGHSERDHIEEVQTLTVAFLDGFRAAEDKTSFLRLAGIPFERTGDDGLRMHLVDASVVSNWQIGTASPGFGSRELAYMPFPGNMVRARETMKFTYVSLTERADMDLAELLSKTAKA